MNWCVLMQVFTGQDDNYAQFLIVGMTFATRGGDELRKLDLEVFFFHLYFPKCLLPPFQL